MTHPTERGDSLYVLLGFAGCVITAMVLAGIAVVFFG